MTREPLDDEAFLDDVFERALAAAREGHALDAHTCCAERPHLVAAARELVGSAAQLVGARIAPTSQLSHYSIGAEIGAGAMGTVYAARQLQLGGREVALKVLPPAIALSPRARSRFLAEARALARMRHPGVVAIHDVVEEPGVLAYAMERIDGWTLAELIARRRANARAAGAQRDTRASHAVRRASTSTSKNASAEAPRAADSSADLLSAESWVPWVCRRGVELARALAAVHAEGLVHRDVKPANVLVRRDGCAVLSDFGLVRANDASLHTQTGAFLGTLAYAAPEQVRGEPADARSDVYALGATLYEALLSRPPHAGDDVPSVLRAIESGVIARPRALDPALPRDLDVIVMKALEPEPGRRYASAADVADELERVLALQPIRARAPRPLERLARWMHRHRATTAAVALGALACAPLSVLAWRRAREQAERPALVARELRAARLELLDEDLGTRAWVEAQSSTTHGAARERAPLERALACYDRCLELEPRCAEAAAERAVVAAWLSGAADVGDARDARVRGLGAYLRRDIDAAHAAWGALDLAREPDPLVDALHGQVLLARGAEALAWPRLLRAADAFPECGDLALASADAAASCGDAGAARRLLERARACARPPSASAASRVDADVLWLEGEDERAFARYEALVGTDWIAHVRLGQLREQQGRLDRALNVYLAMVRERPAEPARRHDLARAAEAWWGRLDAPARRERLRRGLEHEVLDFGNVYDLLRAHGDGLAPVGAAPTNSRASSPAFVVGSAGEFTRDSLLANPESLASVAARIDAQRFDQAAAMRMPAPLRAAFAELALRRDGGCAAATLVRLDALWGACFALARDALGGGPAPARDTTPWRGAWRELRLDDRVPVLGAPSERMNATTSATMTATNGASTASARANAHAALRIHTFAGLGDVDRDGDGAPEWAFGCVDDASAGRGAGCVVLAGIDAAVPYARRCGEQAFDAFGGALCALPDIDGDGCADLAAGASQWTRVRRGYVLVLSGADLRVLARIGGPSDGSSFGTSLCCVGDADLDGGVDLAIGAPSADMSFEHAGAVLVHAASDARLVRVLDAEGPGDSFGYCIVALDDRDGDAVRELAIGAPQIGAPGPGYVQLRSPRTGALLARWRGADGARAFGSALGAVADEDGDARAELVIATWYGDALDRQRGLVEVRASRDDALLRAWRGDRERHGLGRTLCVLPDVDGDGRAELGIGYGNIYAAEPVGVRVLGSRGALLADWPGIDALLAEPRANGSTRLVRRAHTPLPYTYASCPTRRTDCTGDARAH